MTEQYQTEAISSVSDSAPRRYLGRTNLPHPDQGQFLEGLTIIRDRLLMVTAGDEQTALAITLTGRPGNGKTELSRRVADLIPELEPSRDCPMPIARVTLTGGTTVKSLWIDICDAVQVEVRPRETEAILVPRLFRRLRSLGTRMIVIDEAHHALTGGDGDIQVANRLKSRILDHADFPIFLLLVGLPDIDRFIDLDPQLGRRTIRTRLRDLTRAEAHQVCRSLLTKGAQRAGVSVAADIAANATCDRLADACGGTFGVMIDLVDRALRHAVASKRGFVISDDLVWSGRSYLGTVEDDVFDGR